MIRTSRTGRRVVNATNRQIEEQLLYHKNSKGEYDISISSYWDKVVCRAEPSYAGYRFSQGDRRVVCPFHDDIAPSLGLVIDPETGIEVFNCFGCGAKGTITYFHYLFYTKYKNGSKNQLESMVRLAKIYGVTLQGKIEENVSEEPTIDFRKAPPYNARIHRENIAKLKEIYNNGDIGLSDLKESLSILTLRVLKAKTKTSKESEGTDV